MPTFCTAEDRRREWEIGNACAKAWGLTYKVAKGINSPYDGMLDRPGTNVTEFLFECKQRDMKDYTYTSILLGARKIAELRRLAAIHKARALFVVYLKNEKRLLWVDLARTEGLRTRRGGRTMTTREDAVNDVEDVIDIPLEWFEDGLKSPRVM